MLVLKVKVMTSITFGSAVSVECPRQKHFSDEDGDYWRGELKLNVLEKRHPNCNGEMLVIYGSNAGFREGNNLLASLNSSVIRSNIAYNQSIIVSGELKLNVLEKRHPNCNGEMLVIYGSNAGFREGNNLLASLNSSVIRSNIAYNQSIIVRFGIVNF